MSVQLTVSLVVYGYDEAVLSDTLRSLREAIDDARVQGELGAVHITLVDNADHEAALETLLRHCFHASGDAVTLDVISGHGNVGFGQAHNLVIHRADSEYYLILNPDVIVDDKALSAGIRYLQQTPSAVAVSPAIFDGHGAPESGCKRYPGVLDFLLRGFAPTWLKQRFSKRLAHYEMRDLPADQLCADVPIISGCFMLFRHNALRQLGGFDPRYFLYFEDFDLSLRARALGSLGYLPQMRITHLGGNSARKGLRHIVMFGRSGFRFFSSHGWRWL
ncbi:glycosyltransferase family 2 protein [Pseudohongiella sp.]|uniref:Glycosyltransferase 2-like domain-containing protein n=1 Tax=marine sediment metagenome TaxID=412755 RepID=A0A0F9VUQ3_9ZZZZ|nr:glycosyltransferase family 2 protein [Pseudohongiella sp.]HDZ08720.1 glycosyltransferase family 2 protein [Pseudohongiella sp.]HEA62336.1 glycosyltransferase family 2 protein [Pseudohongiella sp.]